MPASLRFAICNELFEKQPFADVCRQVSELGFTGIELAPFTFGEDPASLSGERRKELGAAMAGEGLAFCGLHWLLATPPWIHVAAADEDRRKRSWDYVGRLIDLCGDLAIASHSQDTVIVFGSPKQRSSN